MYRTVNIPTLLLAEGLNSTDTVMDLGNGFLREVVRRSH